MSGPTDGPSKQAVKDRGLVLHLPLLHSITISPRRPREPLDRAESAYTDNGMNEPIYDALSVGRRRGEAERLVMQKPWRVCELQHVPRDR